MSVCVCVSVVDFCCADLCLRYTQKISNSLSLAHSFYVLFIDAIAKHKCCYLLFVLHLEKTPVQAMKMLSAYIFLYIITEAYTLMEDSCGS